jgi:DNA repair protein RadC
MYNIPEIKIRLIREQATIRLQGPDDARSAVRYLCAGTNPSVESLCVLYLNARNHLLSGRVVAMGGVSSLVVTAREVFQGACDAGASAIIVGHNHPSGSPNPSEDDIEMTKHLVKAGEVLGIPVVDHIIVTDCGRTHSFLESGML